MWNASTQRGLDYSKHCGQKTIGFELEADSNIIPYNVRNYKNLYYSEDFNVTTDAGAWEYKTVPFTIEESKEVVYRLYNTFKPNIVFPTNGRTRGLHVHIKPTITAEYKAKLFDWFVNNRRFLKQLSRRNASVDHMYPQWGCFLQSKTKSLSNKYAPIYHNEYQTIEFRLWRATDNPKHCIGYCELSYMFYPDTFKFDNPYQLQEALWEAKYWNALDLIMTSTDYMTNKHKRMVSNLKYKYNAI